VFDTAANSILAAATSILVTAKSIMTAARVTITINGGDKNAGGGK
jgi:hypothetical protein